MAKIQLFFSISLLFSSAFSTSAARPTISPPTSTNTHTSLLCSSYNFSNNKHFAACTDLPVLGSSIHWKYNQSSNTVSMAYRQPGLGQLSWIAWAINPTLTGMIGSQALVALQRSDGSIAAYTSPIASYGTQLQQGNLSFPVLDLSAAYDNEEMIIFATIQLPSNTTVVNHVWQVGPVSENTPRIHSISASHVQSIGTLDFISGKVVNTTSYVPLTSTLTISHGALNALSWGFLMSIGAIITGYVKLFQVAGPVWFSCHIWYWWWGNWILARAQISWNYIPPVPIY